MRLFGITMLVVGILWIVWDAASGFVTAQHSMWIWQSQQMPTGEKITRSQASGAMRELSLALKDRHRIVVIPALLMLVGGFTAAFGRSAPRHQAP